MAFTETGKYYHSRRVDHAADTWKMAAELFVRRVETYLYATDEPGYMKPEFLSWAIAVYDATKQSSGTVKAGLDWEPDSPDQELLKLSDEIHGPRDPDLAVRFNDDARASTLIDTTPKDGD